MEKLITKPRLVHNRRGMILVMVMLIMAIMSLIGAAALTTSRLDMQISGNTRRVREAFFIADAGVEVTPKVIRFTIENNMVPYASHMYVGYDVFNEIFGYTHTGNATTITETMGERSYSAEVDRTGQAYRAGGGVEFGSGAEGLGVGSQGGVLIFYALTSTGSVSNTNTTSVLEAYYRYVVGVVGGK